MARPNYGLIFEKQQRALELEKRQSFLKHRRGLDKESHEYKIERYHIISHRKERHEQIKKQNEKFDKSQITTEFKRWKIAVHERDGYICMECGSKFVLQAHHIKLKSKFPELKYNVDNGITLCIICHATKHPDMAVLNKQAKYYSQYQ